MNKQIIFGLIICIFVVAMTIPTAKNKLDEAWEMDKEKICLPYTTNGIVAVKEGNEHCSEEEINEKNKFLDYYCNLYSCRPVWKTEKKVKSIYEEWSDANVATGENKSNGGEQ
jgi:hypothetical protein